MVLWPTNKMAAKKLFLVKIYTKWQCSGSMPFWGGSGSGSADPCLWLIDPDPDPAIFVIDLRDASKNLIFNTIFFAYYFLKVHLHHFSKIKSQKDSQNRRNQGLSYYFCMMIEGSWSIPLTCGSGSWRPKNMWTRWIRIRIRNTVFFFISGTVFGMLIAIYKYLFNYLCTVSCWAVSFCPYLLLGESYQVRHVGG
jgi:hypothetical protein